MFATCGPIVGDVWHQCWGAVEAHGAAILVLKVQKPCKRIVLVVWPPACLDVRWKRVRGQDGGERS